MTPRLVVLTGYPTSGKSTIARYMQDELGFCKIGTDDIGEMLYGKSFPGVLQDEQGELKESIMRYGSYHLKMLLISEGFDTVLDVTAPTNDIRRQWLDTKHVNGEFPAEKYLMTLRVDKEELLRRPFPEIVPFWDKHWEEPEENPVGYELLLYRNNTPQDREVIYADLKQRFGKKGKIWVPVSS